MTAAIPRILQGVPSPSAEEVAVYRAAHQVQDSPRVFEDPLALSIIGDDARKALVSWPPRLRLDSQLRAFIALRSRVAEDELASAVQAGARQYVILGAGLDTFACRNPYAHLGVRVFEVDLPATQAWKRARLVESRIAIPESLSFVPVDFREQSLIESLRKGGLLPAEPAFFAMLGVAIFLPAAIVTSILTFVASLPSPSGIVFDYGVPNASLPEEQRAARERAARAAAAAGEPFVTFLDPLALALAARRLGFATIDDLGYVEGNARYFAQRADALRLGASGRRIVALRR